MKVKSVAGLAALGMFLSSVTVWSLTKPRIEAETELTLASADSTDKPIAPEFSGAAFTTGKTLMMEGRLGHSRIDAGKDNQTMLLVNVTSDKSATTSTPSPLNLAIVIDRSGSMKGRRLANALDAARGMVRRLRDGDVVSVTTYNTASEVVVPPTSIDSFSRDRVVASVGSITAQGDTCISCGIDTGLEQLRARSGMVDRLLLLSDGEATAGVRDVEGFRAIASRVRNLGASISAVGVDVDYNERVMNMLALESNGRHYFVENESALSRVFDQELDTLTKSLAKDAEIAVELAPGVEIERVFDRTFRRDGNRVLVPMGSFSAGEEKTLLVSLRIPRGASGARPIADVHMTYDDLANGGSAKSECDGKLAALLTNDPSAVSELDPFVQTRMLRSQTAAALTEANELFSRGRTDEAKKKLADRLSTIQKEREVALSRAPAPAKDKLGGDFARQEQALGEANSGFGQPNAAPPVAGAAPTSAPSDNRAGKAQQKRNSVRALDLAF